jgi:diaminopimelate epimerase
MPKSRAYKAQCNGNDFVILFIDQLDSMPDKSFVKHLCDRRSGIGADGLITLNMPLDGYDFKMDYFNNDGSWETMCANGALCAIELLLSRDYKFIYNLFLAGDGDHEMRIEGKNIYIRMKPPSLKTKDLNIEGYVGAHVDSGAKHFVTQSDITDINEIREVAKIIRYDDSFAPNGLNVNFYQVDNLSQIQVITYEKGIEKVMMSCGSGSVAAAYYASRNIHLESPLTIVNRGGDMQLTFDELWNDVWLNSNPQIEFDVEL